MSIEILAALAIGFFGSFHCIGMCGPIALALPVASKSNFTFFNGRILYNIGRIISYSIMGALFGLIGLKFKLWGFQQSLSIILGILILVFILIPSKYRNRFLGYKLIQNLINPLKAKIGSLFKRNNHASLLVIGILNGFLPCGFVFMALFGFGTFPAMFAVSVFGKFIGLNFRSKLSKLTPMFAIMLAAIFILRGLNIGIPYVSPKMSSHSQTQNMN